MINQRLRSPRERPAAPEPIPGARLLFSLDPAVSHLNHGSFGAVPIGVQRAQQRLRDEMEANPLRFFTQGLVDRIAHSRRHLAGFLGADPDGSALVGNTTTGVAVVLQSLGLRPGDEVLSTDHGYGAVSLAIQRECRRTGAVSRVLPVPLAATDEQVVQIVSAGLRPGRTRLLVVDQLTSATAKLLPVAAIVGVAHEHDVPVLVDAAHAPGMLPTPVDSIGADFWAGNLHKWGYAPRGTALLAVAAPWRDRIEPLVVSWEQDTGYPARIEWQATLDYTPGWPPRPACSRCAVSASTGSGSTTRRSPRTASGWWGTVSGCPRSAARPRRAGVALRLIPLPAGIATTIDAARALQTQIGARLAAEVAVMSWNGQGWLRLTGQVYNTAAEYERLAVRLPALLAQR
ncbi:aminotransferase class V-fold PLP-dependent enzyme [Micromonospora vulcania]